MRKWLRQQLKGALDRSGPIYILDPDQVVWPDEISDELGECEIETVEDWFALRKLYEHEIRHRAAETPRPVVLVRSSDLIEPRDLPYDIEKSGSAVSVFTPVVPEFRSLVAQLPGDQQDAAVIALRDKPARPVAALVRRVWGVEIDNVSESVEMKALVRLRTDDGVPPELWGLVAPVMRGELSRALAQEPPGLASVQEAWDQWVSEGDNSSWNSLFKEVGVGIAPLFHAGLLKGALRGAANFPAWARFGVLQESSIDTVHALLGTRPEPWPPVDQAGWVRTAEWWGEIRAALAEGASSDRDLADEAWNVWASMDAQFREWLRENLGGQMLSAARWPATVDKIAPFLARRMQEEADRILLVVMDGMGFSQWSILRRAAGIRVEDVGGVLAMVPTLTPISRQAIFAGLRPSSFADSLMNTMKDGRRWEEFWARQAEAVIGARYKKVMGHFPQELPEFGSEKVVGMVIEAIDKTLHGAELMGDAQVAAAVKLWGERGYLRALVERAKGVGFEVWITSDHGNLEILPLGRVLEGERVEAAGVRVRLNRTELLREGSLAEGEIWDPPGLPEERTYPLFAKGRGGWFSSTGGSPRVTHGGISLDEVIVPLARIST